MSFRNPALHKLVSKIKTFLPLIAIFSLIAIFTLSRQLFLGWDWVRGMNDFMAGFFLVFGAFKVVNWKGFVDAYSMYDIIAKRSRLYGYVYPLIELSLGFAYLFRFNPGLTNWVTLAVMAISGVGVAKQLLSKNQITCACLGAVFKIPMTKVTLIEDLLMGVMALAMILFIAFGTIPAGAQQAYSVEVTFGADDLRPGAPARIAYVIKNEAGETQREFDIAHEKIMHLIVVRKDLNIFAHLHPDFDKETGEFSADVEFPSAGEYRLFPDFTPRNSSNVTLYFDVNVGDSSAYLPEPLVVTTNRSQKIGDYEVLHNIPSVIQANQEIEYSLEIKKNGSAVDGIEDYLGAKGHSVVLRGGSLDFTHGHPKNPNRLMFRAVFREAGRYKIFTQFKVFGKVLTSSYVVEVAGGGGRTSPGHPDH